MTSYSNGAVLGFTQDGTLGPGEKGIQIPEVSVQGEVNGTAVVVGEPVYYSITAGLTADGQITKGNANLYTAWLRTAPATAYLHAGFIGVVVEIVSRTATKSICKIQLQGICEVAKVDAATAAGNALNFTTAGELDIAVAGGSIVAYALAADVAGVAPVLLLGEFRGFLGPVV